MNENCEGSSSLTSGQNIQRDHQGYSQEIRNTSDTIPENWDVSVWSTWETKNLKKSSRMLERNWKRQWLSLGSARQVRTTSMVRPVINPMTSNQIIRVFGNRWIVKTAYGRIHIAGKEDNSLQHYNLVNKFIPMPQALRIPAAKTAIDKKWKNWRNFRRGIWRKSKVRKGWSMKQGRSDAKSSFCITVGHLSIWKMLN